MFYVIFEGEIKGDQTQTVKGIFIHGFRKLQKLLNTVPQIPIWKIGFICCSLIPQAFNLKHFDACSALKNFIIIGRNDGQKVVKKVWLYLYTHQYI